MEFYVPRIELNNEPCSRSGRGNENKVGPGVKKSQTQPYQWFKKKMNI